MSRIFRDFFMINSNGKLIPEHIASISINNRGFHYSDAVFETIKVIQGEPLFWEEHYFRLMASMRVMRMEIPMNFTLEFLRDEIIKLINAKGIATSNARVKLSVFRKEGGYYLPEHRDIGYFISATEHPNENYTWLEEPYVVELFKDYFIAPHLLSTLKTTNKIVNTLGSIYAEENDYHNCLLMNTNKMVIEALNGNIFLVNGTTIKTPPLSDGCLKGIMRQQIISIIESDDACTLEEASISPFELQKADELFITNVMMGVRPITKYRKKTFATKTAKALLDQLNKRVNYTKDSQEH